MLTQDIGTIFNFLIRIISLAVFIGVTVGIVLETIKIK